MCHYDIRKYIALLDTYNIRFIDDKYNKIILMYIHIVNNYYFIL